MANAIQAISDQPVDIRRAPWPAVAAAGVIAAAAFCLRLSFTDFPTGRHSDEPVIATLAKRSAENGHFTANWVGAKEGIYWDRPTYQFSPYTLSEEAIHWVLYRTLGWPGSIDDHIFCARRVSCMWGALAVFVTFLATYQAFGSLGAAFLAEGTVALCPLHVEDSMYARVDTLVCLGVVLCCYCSFAALKRIRPGFWAVSAALVAGVTIAAKYNAAPALLIVLSVPISHWMSGRIGLSRAGRWSAVLMSLAVIGFLLATPEALVDARPLIDGVRFELAHYQQGHVPFQAYGWADNNLVYWTTYMARLGFGWLPLLAAVLFMARTIGRLRNTFASPRQAVGVEPNVAGPACNLERTILAFYLLVAGGLALLPKVRFERNQEVLLAPLAMASALGAMDVLGRLQRFWRGRLGGLPAAVFLVLFFGQQARTLLDLREALNPEFWPWPQAISELAPAGYYFADLMDDPNQKPRALAYRLVFLSDYNDPFSAANKPRWLQFLGPGQTIVFHSKWSEHGYPFSTIDVTFGPARLYCIRRNPVPAK